MNIIRHFSVEWPEVHSSNEGLEQNSYGGKEKERKKKRGNKIQRKKTPSDFVDKIESMLTLSQLP